MKLLLATVLSFVSVFFATSDLQAKGGLSCQASLTNGTIAFMDVSHISENTYSAEIDGYKLYVRKTGAGSLYLQVKDQDGVLLQANMPYPANKDDKSQALVRVPQGNLLTECVTVSQQSVEPTEVPSAVNASVETYEILAAARCICNASLVVRSSAGVSGHVLDSQKVDSITVLVNDQEVELKNPPKGIRDYYSIDAGRMDTWVLEQLKSQKFDLGQVYSVRLLSFTGAVELYTDETGLTPVQN